jgi:hypothetical protein
MNSFEHQPEASHAREIRKSTASQNGGLAKRALPAFAGRNPALRIGIKKNIVPALAFEPIGERHSLGIVFARMA